MIKKIAKFIYCKFKYRKLLKFDFSVKIGKGSKFEGMNKLHSLSFFNGNLGLGSYIGGNSNIEGSVGRFTSIAPNVIVNPGIHPLEKPFTSTSPVFYSVRKQNGSTFVNENYFDEIRYADKKNKFPIIIGNDCWVGQGVFINGGITIGDGAVVLAHSVVSKNIPPYAVVGGVPAKVIKYRFDKETIDFLLKLKWWNKSESWLKDNYKLINDINKLKEYDKFD